MKKLTNQSRLITEIRPAATVNNTPKIARTFKKYRRLIYVVALVATVLLLAGIISSRHTTPGQKELSMAESRVGKLMILPKNEAPTLAAVEDKSRLTDPYLKQKAENGDQLLIYTKNLIVIVYRPSINKIAAVGTIDADPALPEAQGASITVLNGIDDTNKTQKIISQVKAAYPDLRVVDGGKTNKQDFMTTIMIDNTNNKDNLVNTLAAKIGAKRGIVPLSEAKSATDLMIIVGKD